MYNLVSKLLDPLSDPLVLALLLSLCAFLFRRRRRLAFGFATAAVVLLLICSSKAGERMLVRSLEARFPDVGTDVPPAEAIVVLGGAIRMPSGEHHATAVSAASDRLLVAFRLYRAGKAPLILCSGGSNPLADGSAAPESSGIAALLGEWGIPLAVVRTEGGSINTHENAVRSYQVLAPAGIRKILLVTSAIHMPRAAGAFRKAGFEVIAVPADFRSGWGEPNLWTKWFPRADNLEDAAEAIHEWLGFSVYRLRGWI